MIGDDQDEHVRHATLVRERNTDRGVEVEHLRDDRADRLVVVTTPVGLRPLDHQEEAVRILRKDVDRLPGHRRKRRRARAGAAACRAR